MTQPTTKLLSTVAFAALASIALPAFAQEAPATTDQSTSISAPAPVAPPIASAPSVAAPIVQQSAPAPIIAQQQAQPAYTLPVPRIDVPAERPAQPAKSTATRSTTSTAASTPNLANTERTEVISAATAPVVANVTPTPTVEAPAAEARTSTIRSTTATPAQDGTDWTLIGGIAAAGGIAALGLGGLAISRRRREDEYAADQPVVDRSVYAGTPVGDVAAGAPGAREPSYGAAPAMTPVAAPAVRSVDEFAGSGRHVATALHGPTPENPFLTERARMRRARFLDMREAVAQRAEAENDRVAVPVQAVDRSAELQTTYVLGKANPPRLGFGLRPSRI